MLYIAAKRLVIVGLFVFGPMVCAQTILAAQAVKQQAKASEKYPKQSASAMPKFLDAENGPKGEGWINLFNGKNLNGWIQRDTECPMSWQVKDGILVNTSTHDVHGTDIYTEQRFADFELYYEYRVPKDSNSGVYLRGRYEIQIWDQKHENPTWNNGAIFNFAAPSQDVSKEAGQWQSVYAKIVGHKVTVILNGVKIIDNVELTRPTGAQLATVSVMINGEKIIEDAMVHHGPWGDAEKVTVIYEGNKIIDEVPATKPSGNQLNDILDKCGPIMLQGNHGSVDFRYIMLREIKGDASK